VTLPAIEGWPGRATRADAGSAQGSSKKGVYLIMKLKLPLLDLWLVTGRRLRAGYAHRYRSGYEEGRAAGLAGATRHAAEVRAHSDTVPGEGDSGGTEPRP
jgi:hypothetical protein